MTDARTIDDLWRFLAACVDCGKPHSFRPATVCSQGCKHGGTWADPGDGHSYRRKDLRDIDAVRASWEAGAS